MASEARVTISIAHGVADVRLARPEKRNALDEAMFDALIGAAGQVAADPAVRAVVLSGDGKAFCAGLDVAVFAQMAAGAGPDLRTRHAGDANKPQHAALVWRDLPVPVIAAVHGIAFGGGLQIALGADLRFVAPDAKLSLMEIKWGLVPDMGAMLLLPRLLRDDVTRDLVYTGRIFSGEEALGLGLATRLCADPHDAALAYAREIAGKNPDAIRAAKRLMAVPGDRAAILRAESDEQMGLIGSPNQREAVRAAMAGETPRFS
jgi:enoyl-CoA hydratase/carnithine racemase